MSDKIKCPSCGKEIKATAKFCGFCATKLTANPVEEETKSDKTISDEVSAPAELSAYENPLDTIPSRRGTRGDGSVAEKEKAPTEPEKIIESAPGKICVSCGKKFPAKAKFCGVCGETLIDDTADINIKDEAVVIEKKLTAVEPAVRNTKTPSNIHPDFKPAGDL